MQSRMARIKCKWPVHRRIRARRGMSKGRELGRPRYGSEYDGPRRIESSGIWAGVECERSARVHTLGTEANGLGVLQDLVGVSQVKVLN